MDWLTFVVWLAGFALVVSIIATCLEIIEWEERPCTTWPLDSVS